MRPDNTTFTMSEGYNPMTAIVNHLDESSRQYSPELFDDPTSDSPILDSIISAANVVNKIFSASSCARMMCQVYTEKQIDFEIRQDRLLESQLSNDGALALTASEDSGCCSHTSSPVNRAHLKCASAGAPGRSMGAFEVQLYREFLFDEESVVDAIRNRSGDEQD
jgi:hypothetical protein